MTGNKSQEWVSRWLDSVVSGKATMSQRAMTSIEAHGGIKAVVKEARAKGIHLVKLTDDKGKVLIAASRKPFSTLC